MQTLLAPGVSIREIDKSQYSPAMTGTNCLVMGFTDRGEPYTPMEFTSRAAWSNYYGEPDNEAERYAYAAICEVLNQGGRLYFSRLPYDNAAFEKVAAFKYSLAKHEISANFDETTGEPEIIPGDDGEEKIDATPFWEILKADSNIKDVYAIEPKDKPFLVDLSAVDEYRTDEAKVANNTFMIVDTAFNTYGRVAEDDRKDSKCELIGIMPVITTAANALYAQSLIDVKKENVIGYETIGEITTLDAASQISSYDAKLSSLVANTVRESDMAKLVNTKSWYKYVAKIDIRTLGNINISGDNVSVLTSTTSAEWLSGQVLSVIKNESAELSTWDGRWQLEETKLSGETVSATAMFSYLKPYDKDEVLKAIDDGNFEFKPFLERFGWHNPGGDDNVPETVSQEANSFFPPIDFDGEHFDQTHLKKIGVVVYKMFLDPSEGNKISFEPVESFAGSLCKTDKDPNTGVTTFIDTIINSQSQYINFFSNCFNTPADKKYYNEQLDMLVVRPGAKPTKDLDITVNFMREFVTELDKVAKAGNIHIDNISSVQSIQDNINKIQAVVTKGDVPEIPDEKINAMKDRLVEVAKAVAASISPDTTTPSLGFYSAMTKEDISITKSIYDGMNKVFDKCADINERDIDIVPDAGIANIASYLKAIFGDKGPYDLQVTDDAGNSLLGMWKCDSNNPAIKTWKTVEQKLDNFCKNIRKDCMFIADGPRPLVLAGQKKIVRSTKPQNTIDANIIPNIKWVTGLNTSYGAMYVDWFEQADDYSGDFFWCPPSIKAMGVYINTDVNFNYWDAPAGLNRGVIAATDVAFSPTNKQAGSFYEKNLNYAINYPQDGIVLEGQKTLQTKPSALDRVNVRRLMLRLERASARVAKWTLYQGNTAYSRQRLVDALDPYFKEAKIGGGLIDYKLICDESVNPDYVIDRNELIVKILVKPVKSIEFIALDFVIGATGATWEELL